MPSAQVGARSNIADMAKDPFYLWIEKTYVWHIAGAVALLFAIGGWPYVVWGMVRIELCSLLSLLTVGRHISVVCCSIGCQGSLGVPHHVGSELCVACLG